ncbi:MULTISPECIES: response regulator [unclassified Leptolyngbya]|uniref:response regulator n=1 Tax=unclassified Leptolyngbya TaxID=2650499 RepID=UPI0016836C22|nr:MULTISPECIES: response regulator [unclassified Leptolyngbya]MBD1914110.1 response regulator [Leptolyngbya sp. FACHB-8]MBD2158147.1 response regulator [Leptolyngbya sp. FACHB-16]
MNDRSFSHSLSTLLYDPGAPMLTTADLKMKLKFSILIVDDQPDNLRTLSAILRDERYTVRQAISGQVALDAVQVSLPDLILLDIRMPEMDGYEVCSILKANPETCHIPVIFLSALNDVNDKVKAFTAGAVDYITKPFQAEEVLIRIGHQLTIQQQQQQLRNQNQRLQEAGEILQFQAEQERVMGTIIQRIRESLDKKNVFDTTVSAIQHLLRADRVLIYQLFPNGTGKVVAESVLSGFPSILGMVFPEEVFPSAYYELYEHGRICIINDVHNGYADITPCLVEFIDQWAVQAKLVVPILLNGVLWGLLIIHQCGSPRAWLSSEVSLLSQLAGQIAIAIQQAELYQEIQSFNLNLEQEVSARTAELRQALSFQAMLKRISDKVRDSLDSQQILQSVVEELAIALDATACDAALHSPDHRTSTISYQYVQPGVEATQGQQTQIQDASELYAQLHQGHSFAFCQLESGSIRKHSAILVCPIVDGQSESDMMGDLWVFKPAAASYSEMEMHLVEQVANQCAIALRQAQLYEAVQTQLQEQQRLNQLKDDFLSTISHELRTPIASIRMIARLLMSITHQGESFVQKMVSPEAQNNKAAQYLKVLQDEAERELTLIEDLLSLQHIEAGVYALDPTPISLQDWLPHMIETFEIRAQEQQQTLKLTIAPNFPGLEVDLPSLSRIVTELLNNACKYTPPGEAIFVRAFAQADQFFLQIENMGTEIAPEELLRIFDKFYRIPNNDPWKHGGTGLGLALVKKLVEHMGGTITAKSSDNTMQFVVQCPISSKGLYQQF